jgi:hypothetical protein
MVLMCLLRNVFRVQSVASLPAATAPKSKLCSSGGWNRTSGLHVQSVASLPAATTPESSRRVDRFGKEDSNLHRLIQSQGAFRLADSRERPAGVEPACQTWKVRAWPPGPRRNTNRKRSILNTETTKQTHSDLFFPPFPLFPSVKESSLSGGRRGSRTPKAHRSPEFESGAVANRLALPRFSSTGGRIRTSNRRLNRAPPFR